jgi:hypothetical protein
VEQLKRWLSEVHEEKAEAYRDRDRARDALTRERALCDRLAAALGQCLAWPTSDDPQQGCIDAEEATRAALAEHAAARKGET